MLSSRKMGNYNCLWIVVILLSSCSFGNTEHTDGDIGNIEKEKEVSPAVQEKEAEETLIKNTANYHTVVIRHMKFEPSELKLNKGDTVLWINKDITDHDVTEEAGNEWASPKIPKNKSWSKIVTRSADYFCSIHVVMKGRLLVE